MTDNDEYCVKFVKQENGLRRRIQHGDITLHAVIEKRTPAGRIFDKSRLGSIDSAALEFGIIRDRDEFWRITDLYLTLFDIPTDAADVVCSYLSQIVRPVSESEAASYYGYGERLRETSA
jgi:hypothetical protein